MRLPLILLILCALSARADIGNGGFDIPGIGCAPAGWLGNWIDGSWLVEDGAATCAVSKGSCRSITSETILPPGVYVVTLTARRLTPDDGVVLLRVGGDAAISLFRVESADTWRVRVESATHWRLTLECGSATAYTRISVDDISVECVEPVYGAGAVVGGVGW